MIQSIFIISVLICFFFLTLAYFYDKNNQGNGLIFVRMTAWLVLFVLFFGLTYEGVDYQTGYIMDNETGQEITTYTYDKYTNHTAGYLFAVVSAIGFISCFFDLKGPDGW